VFFVFRERVREGEKAVERVWVWGLKLNPYTYNYVLNIRLL
jgi:hypothetical protein